MLFSFLYTAQARAGIREVHFLPFNPVDKRTALTYIDYDGNWHRASKGAPEQVLIIFFFLCSSMLLIWNLIYVCVCFPVIDNCSLQLQGGC